MDDDRPSLRLYAAHRIEDLACGHAGVHARWGHAAREHLERDCAGGGHRGDLIGVAVQVAAEGRVVDMALVRDRGQLLAQGLGGQGRRPVERHVDHARDPALRRRSRCVLVGLPAVSAKDVEVLVDEPGHDRQARDVHRLVRLERRVGKRRDLPVPHSDVHLLDEAAGKHGPAVQEREVKPIGHGE